MARILFKRRWHEHAQSLGPPTPADDILGRLLDPSELIDRFDATYLDDLPAILAEVHGVTEENAREHARWPELRSLWELGPRPLDDFRVVDLTAVAIEAGADERRWTPLQVSEQQQKRWGYNRARAFRDAAGVRLRRRTDDNGAVEAINQLQADFSHDVSGGDREFAFEELAREATGDPWTRLITDLRECGVLSADEPHLTIGPRWVGEIHYFREGLGLPQAIGLDLFTHDEELVRVGDMHDMPFADSTFGLVYQRNTFDKSYDIRQALRECVRVLRDGGVLITDDCYDYTNGVSPITRTNLKWNRQVLRVLGAEVAEVLYDEEPDATEDWIRRYGQLAVRITKTTPPG